MVKPNLRRHWHLHACARSVGRFPARPERGPRGHRARVAQPDGEVDPRQEQGEHAYHIAASKAVHSCVSSAGGQRASCSGALKPLCGEATVCGAGPEQEGTHVSRAPTCGGAAALRRHTLPTQCTQVLLDNVSGKITSGLYACMGPSGSGKVRTGAEANGAPGPAPPATAPTLRVLTLSSRCTSCALPLRA